MTVSCDDGEGKWFITIVITIIEQVVNMIIIMRRTQSRYNNSNINKDRHNKIIRTEEEEEQCTQ